MATNNKFTLAQLRDFVERAGDFYAPAFANELKDHWINAAISAWVDFVFECDDTRFLAEDVIAVTAGNDTYDLNDVTDTDFYRARGLAVADGGSPSGYTRLDKFEWSERHDYSYARNKEGALWDVQGDLLHIWPKPNWSGNVLLEYFQLPAKLVETTDEVDLRNNVTFVVTFVCMHLCPRDESSLKDWEKLHERAIEALRKSSPQNKSAPKSATSVYRPRRFDNQRRMTRLP